MKQLFLTISWLEFVRNKTRCWFFLIILVAFSFLLSTCGHSNSETNISAEITQSSPLLPSPEKNDSAEFNLGGNNFSSFSPFVITGVALFLGFIVLMTIPFRSKQEWEDGQFQMIAMGDHSFYKVESTRFLSYLLLATLFFITVLLCFGIFCWKNEILSLDTIIRLQWLALLRFISFIPLMLAFGVLVAAINTAYYRDGGGRILTLIKYISCFSFFVLAMQAGCWFMDPSHSLIPVMQTTIKLFGFYPKALTFSWDFLVLSVMVAVLFLYWSGRILEEVEA